MSGENKSVLNLPPGLNKNGTQYAIGSNWFNGSQVRWYENMLAPVGGWQKTHTFNTVTQPIRDMFSWRDLLKAPWMAIGSSDKLFSLKVNGPNNYVINDITPAGLAWTAEPLLGYGAGPYGADAYGFNDTSTLIDVTGLWSLDNFGRLLVAVHSQDQRLFSYDPVTPAVPAAVVAGAPTKNTLVICTEEEFLMVLGGKDNPRQVKWASQRTLTDWTPTAINSAGGFDLQSDGSIVAAAKVQGGILVLTDTDIHMIEYTGPPYYYGRRRISSQTGCLGKNCLTTYPQGAIWLSASNFWLYDGNISLVPCSVHNEVFYRSNLLYPSRMYMFLNQFAQEIWLSYPGVGGNEPDRYALMSFRTQPYWSLGNIPRTAWLNPVWQDRPLACYNKDLYEHEVGWLADGVSRNADVFAETGGIEIGEGDNVMRVDRIYPDFAALDQLQKVGVNTPDAASLLFKLKQAPKAPERLYGPVQLGDPQGYTTVRFRARQVAVRVNQEKNEFWTIGKLRLRSKPGGKR